MKTMRELPVLTISNFEDYNQCHHCGNSFYIRAFNEHLRDNTFLDKPHSHDFFIILLITQGTGIHNIDFKSYDVNPGTVFFITPGQIHNWELSPDINGYILFFRKEYLLIDFNQNRLVKLPFFYTSINAPYLHLGRNDNKMLTIFKRIDHEYIERQSLFHEMIRLNLKMLLIECERRYSEIKTLPNLMRYQENQLHKFEMLIEKNYKNHMTVTDYAAQMNISIKQLNTLCKRALNKTPSDLIQERVMLEAKRLLVYSDQSINSIAHILNYIDTSYFIRLFRKVTGITPEQFRVNSLVSYVT